jgi:hypothetical protein
VFRGKKPGGECQSEGVDGRFFGVEPRRPGVGRIRDGLGDLNERYLHRYPIMW